MDKEGVETSLSAFGAGFLGLGIGLTLGLRLPMLGWLLVAGGLATHLAGMVMLHRRRKGLAGQPAWLELAYWLCWAVLAALIGYLGWLAAR